MRPGVSLSRIRPLLRLALPRLPEQLGRVNAKRTGKFFDHLDGGATLLPLQHADMVAADAGAFGELFLGALHRRAQQSKVGGEDGPEAHASTRAAMKHVIHQQLWVFVPLSLA